MAEQLKSVKPSGQQQSREGTSAGTAIRVLIVDDVKSARDLLKDILATDGRFQVIAEVADGIEAVETALRLRPDLITMDIRLPGLDGFMAVEQILAEYPVPIIMITASVGDQRGKLFRAFKAGALDVINKQELYLWRTRPEIRLGFLRKLHALASSWAGEAFSGKVVRAVEPARVERPPLAAVRVPMVVAIATSTGGPSALLNLLKQIPAGVKASFLVVQHMSQGFLEGLVRWLDNEVELAVRKAEEGDVLEPGVVLLAPEDYHMLVTRNGTIRLNKSLPVNGHRPSAELLFDTVADYFGPRSVGVVLTGMGADGASGLKRLRLRGGRTIAQDEHSSVIFGMPRAAIELNAAEIVLPLGKIAKQIMSWISEAGEQ